MNQRPATYGTDDVAPVHTGRPAPSDLSTIQHGTLRTLQRARHVEAAYLLPTGRLVVVLGELGPDRDEYAVQMIEPDGAAQYDADPFNVCHWMEDARLRGKVIA